MPGYSLLFQDYIKKLKHKCPVCLGKGTVLWNEIEDKKTIADINKMTREELIASLEKDGIDTDALCKRVRKIVDENLQETNHE